MSDMKLWVLGKQGLVGAALSPFGLGTCRLEADLTDEEKLWQFVKSHPGITHIVNCAAFSLVDAAEENKEEAFRINAIGPEILAKIAYKIGAHFTHLSTDYVFSGDGRVPLKETSPTAPCNFYGHSKLEGEQRVQAAYPDSCILRTSWVFGPGGKNLIARLYPLFQEKTELSFVNDQWGRPTYVQDLVQAILALAQMGAKGLYQFANQGITTKYEFARELFACYQRQNVPMRVKRILPTTSAAFSSICRRPAYSAFDTAKIETILPFKIRVWQEALAEFICGL